MIHSAQTLLGPFINLYRCTVGHSVYTCTMNPGARLARMHNKLQLQTLNEDCEKTTFWLIFAWATYSVLSRLMVHTLCLEHLYSYWFQPLYQFVYTWTVDQAVYTWTLAPALHQWFWPMRSRGVYSSRYLNCFPHKYFYPWISFHNFSYSENSQEPPHNCFYCNFKQLYNFF